MATYYNTSFAAPPAPDYVSGGNNQYQNPCQAQYNYQQPQSIPSPYSDTYQHYPPPPAPSYTNGEVPPVHEHGSQSRPYIQQTATQQHTSAHYQLSPPSYNQQGSFSQPSPQPYTSEQPPPPPPRPNESPASQYHVHQSHLQPHALPATQAYSGQTHIQPTPSPGPPAQESHGAPLVPIPSPLQQIPSAPAEKLSLKLHLLREEKGSMRTKFRHTYIWTLGSDYTLTFTAPSTMSPNHASLVMHNGSKAIGYCDWNKSSGWNNVLMRYPWQSAPAAWDPDQSGFCCETGVLNNGAMEWETTVDDQKRLVFKCLSQGLDEDGNECGERGLEVCRVVVDDADDDNCAILEMNGDVFGKPPGRVDQVDEMVVVAMAVLTRWVNGWRTQTPTTTSGGHGGTTKEALKLASEMVSLTSNILQAVGGGG